MEQKKLFKNIVAHAKAYGFVYPSSEIYNGMQSFYDYGPYGVELKKNIQNFWWKSMVQWHENIVGIDTAIGMHPQVWQTSGHIDHFHDILVDNLDSKKRYRVDMLIEQHIAKLRQEDKYQTAEDIAKAMHDAITHKHYQVLYNILIDHNIQCNIAKSSNWSSVRAFNLMFATKIGSLDEEANIMYLRPETAQGIFVNFLNVQKSARMQIPFGVAQVGKAFRNEIVARQFIFRMREFEQMEMQFFIKPDTDIHWFNYWQEKRLEWYGMLGIAPHQLQVKTHGNLAHYANKAVDINYDFPFGSKEIEGIHSRTDFDLKKHEKATKKKLQYFDPQEKRHYTPYVIETSVGCDRLFLMVLCNAYKEEVIKTKENAKTRTYLRLSKLLAPIQAAIFPLVNKDGLPEIARKIFDDLKYNFKLYYDASQTIGKRYTRQDLIGTPYCITIDYDTLSQGKVTIRDRDTLQQESIAIDNIVSFLSKKYQNII